MTPRSGPADPGQKILSLEALVTLRHRLRIEGRSLVVCHGCFDIVHPGHIRHLRQARTMGDVLLVSLTGDAHINKGAGRPLIPQEHRAENLAALDIVDLVYVDPNPTALSMLEAVEPDVYIKGREYENNADPRFRAERETVEKAGGRVVFSSGDVVFSSSALIDAIGQSMDPFHSRLMKTIEPGFRSLLFDASRRWNAENSACVVSNTSGNLHDGSLDGLVDRLTKQISGTVRWVDNMITLCSLPADQVIEIGPGRPLRGFFRGVSEHLQDRPLDAITNLTSAQRTLAVPSTLQDVVETLPPVAPTIAQPST